MKRKLFLFSAVLFLSSLYVSAQELYSKMGAIPEETLFAASLPSEPDASAVLLKEEIATRFVFKNDTFHYETDHFVRIKILKEEGLKYATTRVNYSIASADKPEQVKKISAAVFNWNGKKFAGKYISKKNGIKDIALSPTEHQKVISLSGAKVGSVVEFTYTLVSSQLESLRPWKVQRDIPVVDATYRITVPEYLYYDIKRIGLPIEVLEVNVSQNFGFMSNTLFSEHSNEMTMTAKNLPSFLPLSDYLMCPEDYRTSVNFYLDFIRIPKRAPQEFITNWDNVASAFKNQPRFADPLKASYLNDAVKAIPAGKVEMRIMALLDLVRNNMEWNKVYSIYPEDIAGALKSKKGNSADMNLLLLILARQAGYEASPIVLRTRDMGLIDLKHNNMNAMNHVIVGVIDKGNVYCLDATSPASGVNTLPINDLVERSLILRDAAAMWMDLSKFDGSSVRTINASFNDKGELTGAVSERHLGESILPVAEGMANGNHTLYASQWTPDGATLSSMNSKWGENRSFFQVDYVITDPGTKIEGDKISINPMVMFQKKIPVVKERLLPVDLPYVERFQQIVNITLPEGFVPEAIPQPFRLQTANGSLQAQILIECNGQQLMCRVDYQAKKAFYSTDEYESFFKFFQSLNEQNSKRITFIKK
ncbi:MAG: DUF3857 domain-containing protein [Bacteroidales bacterium]|nr:DUF3857 domain-containing protein [Bacteroidales bacterium]MDD4821506.1 DUF3857 domain-containing protein [Bacteroidales bacterium]